MYLCMFVCIYICTYGTFDNYIQERPSVKGRPPACFDLVDCCDLDLDPLTFISEADLDMIVTYFHAEN